MATLKANGPELLRISYEELTPNDGNVSWRRKTQVYCANGVILIKNDCRFRATHPLDPVEGRFYSWGWKKTVAAKDNPKPLERAAHALALIHRDATGGPNSKWQVEFADTRIKAIAPTDPKYLAPEAQS